MNWRLKIQLVLTTALIVFSLSSELVHASATNLELKILPLNCVFELTNDGLNTITYLTPEECGQLVIQPNDIVNDKTADRISIGADPTIYGPIIYSNIGNNNSVTENSGLVIGENTTNSIANINTFSSENFARNPLLRVAIVLSITILFLLNRNVRKRLLEPK